MPKSPKLPAKRQTTYTAPALEKGLDIVELLAASEHAMTSGQIAERLGRSKNEIFRMVHVLEKRRYLRRDAATDMLQLSNRLFDLGLRTPQPRLLLDIAYPAMQKLSDGLGHSAHLVVINSGETVVIATAAGHADVAFTLRLGYRRPALNATSGQTIIAFQSDEMRKQIMKESQKSLTAAISASSLAKRLEEIRRTGYSISESHDVLGVVDISAPIVDRQNRAIAAIVIPCLKRHGVKERHNEIAAALVKSCRDISRELT